MKMKVQLLAFLLMIIVIGGCRFTVDPTTAPEMNEPVAQFVDDVNQGRMNEAWKLLAADEQAKLDRSQFVAAGNDFKRVSAVFSQSGITTRAQHPKTEFSVSVANFDGKTGAVMFVMHQENGRWRIANILPDPTR
jgi:hypothetical protein